MGSGNGSQRVRELAVFAAAATGDNVGYPLGTGSAETPPPFHTLHTYGDAYHRLVNLAASRPTTTISEASLSAAVAGDPSVGFQLLYSTPTPSASAVATPTRVLPQAGPKGQTEPRLSKLPSTTHRPTNAGAFNPSAPACTVS